jgi:hypothetical protein
METANDYFTGHGNLSRPHGHSTPCKVWFVSNADPARWSPRIMLAVSRLAADFLRRAEPPRSRAAAGENCFARREYD